MLSDEWKNKYINKQMFVGSTQGGISFAYVSSTFTQQNQGHHRHLLQQLLFCATNICLKLWELENESEYFSLNKHPQRTGLVWLMHVCEVASVMSDSATLWTVAHQAPLSTGFSRQEYWSGLSLPSKSPASPALAGRFFTTESLGKLLAYWWLFVVVVVLRTFT